MAGLLESLFAQPAQPMPGAFQLGNGEQEENPYYAPLADYTGDAPLKRVKPNEAQDRDLKKFQETHPITPQQAAASAPAWNPGAGQQLPGMLSGIPGVAPAAAPAAPPVPSASSPSSMDAAPWPAGPVGRPVTPPEAAAPNENAAPPQRAMESAPTTGSPAEGAIDLTDAPVGMLSKVWKGIQDNSGLLMGLGSGMLGAPSWATGFSRGVAGANAGAQQDYKQNQQQSGQQSLYTALVKAGVPKQQAVAATMNPELARTLMADYIGTRKSEIKTLKDSMGNERLVAINPYMDQEQLDKLNNGGAPGGGSGDMGSLAHMPVEYDPSTGRDEKFAAAFKAADPINAEATEALLQGRMPATGRNLQSLMKYAARIDPEFNSTTFGSRQNLDKSYFGGGEGFKQLRSANTTIDHGLQLQKAIDDLKNYQTLPGFLNPMTGKIAEQYSAPYQKALAAFDRWRSIYGHELEFALTGKNTVTGTKEMADQFDRYASPVKNQQSLISSLESLKERIGEHEAAYKGGMKHVTGEPFKDMLTNRAKLEKMLAAAESRAAPPPSEGGVAGPKKIKWSVVQP